MTNYKSLSLEDTIYNIIIAQYPLRVAWPACFGLHIFSAVCAYTVDGRLGPENPAAISYLIND